VTVEQKQKGYKTIKEILIAELKTSLTLLIELRSYSCLNHPINAVIFCVFLKPQGTVLFLMRQRMYNAKYYQSKDKRPAAKKNGSAG